MNKHEEENTYPVIMTVSPCLESWHITEIRPYGMNPCPRRRVGCAKVGAEILICGGTSPTTVVRNGKEREILHDHNDVYILHLGELCVCGGVCVCACVL